MKLEEACNRFNKLAGIRFGELFSPSDMNMIIINKGKTGQLLELSLGMHLSSTNLDFDDSYKLLFAWQEPSLHFQICNALSPHPPRRFRPSEHLLRPYHY